MHYRAIEPLIDDFDAIDVNEKWAPLASSVLGSELNENSDVVSPLKPKNGRYYSRVVILLPLCSFHLQVALARARTSMARDCRPG